MRYYVIRKPASEDYIRICRIKKNYLYKVDGKTLDDAKEKFFRHIFEEDGVEEIVQIIEEFIEDEIWMEPNLTEDTYDYYRSKYAHNVYRMFTDEHKEMLVELIKNHRTNKIQEFMELLSDEEIYGAYKVIYDWSTMFIETKNVQKIK